MKLIILFNVSALHEQNVQFSDGDNQSSWLSSSFINNNAFEKIQTSRDNVIIAENTRTRWLSKQVVSMQKHSLALLHRIKPLWQMEMSLDSCIYTTLGSLQNQTRNN